MFLIYNKKLGKPSMVSLWVWGRSRVRFADRQRQGQGLRKQIFAVPDDKGKTNL